MVAIPSIAVIMPVRNGIALIEKSLESIRAQGFPVELTIIDDGSTDGTREYVRSLNGFCSHVLEGGRLGPSAARNAGISATSAECLAFLDADDLWPPGTLCSLAETLMANPEADFAQGLVQNFRSGSNGSEEFITPPYRFVNLGACLWRRSVFDRVGLFNEDLKLCEDLDLFLRCWEKDVCKAEIDRVTLFYRRHPASMTHGLSGAGFGTVRAYRVRINRIRSGEYDPEAPRRFDPEVYLGTGPMNQDGGL